MKKKIYIGNKIKIFCCDVIEEAFIEYLNDVFIKSRKEANPVKVINPHFWTQGEFVSLDGMYKYNNILYTETQPGTTPDFEYHKIQIAVHYEEYEPYHKKWMRSIERNKLIEDILVS